MTSPLDETTVYASVDRFSEAQSAAPAQGGEAESAYGADEERLVQMARQEAVLRLARAM
jgi:hypothetical protein